MELGQRVRDLRDARRLSQARLAQRAGIARNTLNRIENGHLMPTAPVIERLAGALGVEPGDLFASPKAPAPSPRSPERAARSFASEAGMLDRPAVREWLRARGYVSREEFTQRLEEEGPSRGFVGLQEALEGLHEERDRLKEAVRRHAYELFGPRDHEGGLAPATIEEAMRPAREAWRLRLELNHEYLLRKLDVVAFSKHLYASGETEGYLSFTPERDEDVEEARRQALIEADEAYRPGELVVVGAA
jgi:transcriptional regulator with XRE-family HTH domain